MTLDHLLLDNSVRDWLTALGFSVVLSLLVLGTKRVLLHQRRRRAGTAATLAGDWLEPVARATRHWLVLGVTLFLGSRYLELPVRLEQGMALVATVAAFLQLGLWLSAGLSAWIAHYKAQALNSDAAAATSLSALHFVGRLVIWSALLLVMLGNLGVDVTALVAGLGVGGIAVALAVQNILGDLFASLSIVVDKPFVIGDFIVVDDMVGTIEHVGLKTTRVRSLSGEQIIIANSDLLKTRIRNYKRMAERRIVFHFRVPYRTPPEQLQAIPAMVEAEVRAAPLTRFDRAHLFRFAEFALEFEVVYWMTVPDYGAYMDAQQAINLGLLRRLAAAGIECAHPVRTVYLGQNSVADAG